MLTLKVAFGVLFCTGKGNLWFPRQEHVDDFTVGDFAHLMVLLREYTLLVANTTLLIGHQRIAGCVGVTDVAVDTVPTIFALAAGILFADWAIDAIRQRTAYRLGAVIAAKSWGTNASTAGRVAL